MRSSHFTLIFAAVLALSSTLVAAKPPSRDAPAAAAPEVHAVKVEYSQNRIVIKGADLDGATVTLAGEIVGTDSGSTIDTLYVPFSSMSPALIDGPGSYVLIVATDGGEFTLTAFIPFAITYLPPSTAGCPCQSEWDYYGSLESPDGFADVDPSCASDSGSFVTVQFYDELAPFATNIWVLWTDWNGSAGTGYCELWLDGPTRTLDSIDEYNACDAYLKDIVVWENLSDLCLF